jgi:putative heme transporter
MLSPEFDNSRAPHRRLWILAALWLFVALVLFAFRSVVLPFAGAALIAYLVAPLVHAITTTQFGGRHPPRWLAIILIYLAFFLLAWLFFIALVPQLYRELSRITQSALDYANSLTPERIQVLAQQAEQWLRDHGLPVALSDRALEGAEESVAGGGFSLSLDLEKFLHDAATNISQLVRENLADIVNVSRNIITSVLGGLFMTFFILMVAAFFSIDARGIRSYCRTLIPAEYAEDGRTLVNRIDRSLSGVVRGQVTICLVNGTLTFIGLVLFGVKFAFLLATIATLLSLIPIFGSIISSVPIVMIGLSQSWKTGLIALVWIIGIHALEAYFLNPKIMGSAAKIHPVVVAFALIAGERTFGLVGALFAVPIAAIAVACFDFARQKAQEGSASLPSVP